MNLLPRIYSIFLHLYPPDFRREFAEEMQEVFTLALKETAGQGRLAPAWIFLRELGSLPGSLLRESYAWFTAPAGIDVIHDLESPRPASWLSSGLAALPHLLFALALFLPLLVTVTLALPNYNGPSLPVFWGLVAGVLIVARRLGWPRWSGTWIGYGLVFILTQAGIHFPDGLLAKLAGLTWLGLGALVLIWLTRRDWMGGLLAVLPVSPMWLWLARLDGPPASLDLAALYLSISLVISVVVVVIVRLGRWQTALLLILLLILATGTPELHGFSGYSQPIESGVGGWMASYAGLLVFTAPLWLMALWRQYQRR